MTNKEIDQLFLERMSQCESAGVISTGRAAALTVLKMHGKSSSLSVATVMGKDRQNIGKMLEKLEKIDLVKADRGMTITHFELTEEGKEIIS